MGVILKPSPLENGEAPLKGVKTPANPTSTSPTLLSAFATSFQAKLFTLPTLLSLTRSGGDRSFVPKPCLFSFYLKRSVRSLHLLNALDSLSAFLIIMNVPSMI